MGRVALLCAAALLLGAAAPPMRFTPVGPDYAAAAAEYRSIWESDGERIVAAMERVTGLAFPAVPIEAFVSDTSPMTSYDGRTMRLRAGYREPYKRATLVHELGHVLALQLPRRAGLDDHRLLYLFLYDVWTDLWGRDFADRMVAIERRIPGGTDYDSAWTWALSMSRNERQTLLRSLRPEVPARIGTGQPPSPVIPAQAGIQRWLWTGFPLSRE